MEATQKFTILPAYEEVLRYVEAVQAEPRADRRALYKRIVVDPYWDRFVSGGEFERNLPKEKLTQPPEDLHGLQESAMSIRDSDVESVIVETLERLSKILPGPDTTVCVIPTDPGDPFVTEYMQGVMGAVVGTGRIALQVCPCPGWLERVPAAIAHEYHHSVWLQLKWNEIASFDLLNYLVFEGRACSFSGMLFPGPTAPWTEALTPEQEAEQWRNIRDNLTEDSYEKQAMYMFGGETVPLCTGYTVGFHIVQRFLRSNPQMTVREWIIVDAQELLERSQYDGVR